MHFVDPVKYNILNCLYRVSKVSILHPKPSSKLENFCINRLKLFLCRFWVSHFHAKQVYAASIELEAIRTVKFMNCIASFRGLQGELPSGSHLINLTQLGDCCDSLQLSNKTVNEWMRRRGKVGGGRTEAVLSIKWVMLLMLLRLRSRSAACVRHGASVARAKQRRR